MAKLLNPIKTLTRTGYKNYTLKNLYPKKYLAACKAPVIPGSVVFLEVREKMLSDNFRLIRHALEHRNAKSDHPLYSMTTVCIREGMENQIIVMQNCLHAIGPMATAQFIFVNESSYFLSCLPIRPETTVIQTWHACGAFKKFGFSAVGKGFGTTRADLEKYPVHRNFSYVTVSAPEVVWAYAEAFHMEHQADRILPIGVSRTDMFFSRKFRENACGKTAWILKRLAPELFPDSDSPETNAAHSAASQAAAPGPSGIDAAKTGTRTGLSNRKIILYAPTFRGSVGSAVSPDKLDIPAMKKALGDRFLLLIKHHPFVKPKDRPVIPKDCRNFAFDMTDRLSIEELLTASDICITDYSSIIFEYSLFERPLIFFAYDMQEYLDERGFYYPIREMMPGPVCSDTSEIIDVLQTPDAEFDLSRVRSFKYRFMSACDGHSTQRLLELMKRHS